MAWAIASTFPMQHHKLFNRTRLQLAGWYAGVMGVILGISGVITYQMVAYSHKQAIAQELRSVSGTLHDNLESKLRSPGIIEPSVQAALPGLCVISQPCANYPEYTGRHMLGLGQQHGYYLQFFDRTGQAIAQLGTPPQTTKVPLQEGWQTLTTPNGTRYQQTSVWLKTVTGQSWGYMHVGRSLQEVDDYLATLRWFLLIGLPLGVGFVGGAGWWLAGLSMQPLYQSYARMQQFTADAAHELRTPVAAIRATVEAAQGTPALSEADSQETLAAIARQTKRLAQLVQDLLLLSRLDQNLESLPKSVCCLNDLVTDIVEELYVLELAKSIHLTQQIRVDQPVFILGNEAQISRLLSNLVTNALHYTPAGGAVTVILDRTEQEAWIHVQDTGIGIAPADQLQIFDRFYRVDSDRARHTGGAGLGLAIVKAIVEAHHGTIELHSALGQGSTFSVRFPLKNSAKK